MRLIDADAVVLQSRIDLYAYEADLVKDYLDLFPTIDAVPVVRCKDCKNGEPSKAWDDWWYCKSNNIHHSGDNFCSYGERKDGDTNGK